MKVLMVLSNPIQVDPRVHNEAKALMEKGHTVSIICWDRKKQYEHFDTFDGIKVYNVHNTRLMDRLKNDLLREYFWWNQAYYEAVNVYDYKGGYDVIHCHDLDTLKVGVRVKAVLDVKIVYDAHEIFSEMIKGDVPQFAVWYAEHIENKYLKKVDHVITAYKIISQHIRRLNENVPITMVKNYKPQVYDKYEEPKNEHLTLIYIGVMMKERMFPELVRIIGDIGDARLIIAGKKEALYKETKELAEKYNNVFFWGTITSDMIIPSTHSADASICLLPASDNGSLFNKQFEAMTAGRPLITTKGSHCGNVTEAYKCGFTVDNNPNEIKKLILHLMKNRQECIEAGKRALKLSKTLFNWDEEKMKLWEVYTSLEDEVK